MSQLASVSYRSTSGLDKDDRTFITHFTKHIKCKFSHLFHLLQKDRMYSAFKFTGHYCTTDTLIGTASFIVLDVDHTTIPIQVTHQYLTDEGLVHIIGTTSDPSDMCRYRVLLPLDRPVTPDEYKRLAFGIQANGLVPDLDTSASSKPAGKFFSYANSTVLKSLSGQPLCVDDYMLKPIELLPSNHDPTEVLANFDQHFGSYAYACPGRRTSNLLSAAFKMIEFGLTKSQLTSAIIRLNQQFLVPKSEQEVYRRVINFILSKHKEIK